MLTACVREEWKKNARNRGKRFPSSLPVHVCVCELCRYGAGGYVIVERGKIQDYFPCAPRTHTHDTHTRTADREMRDFTLEGACMESSASFYRMQFFSALTFRPKSVATNRPWKCAKRIHLIFVSTVQNRCVNRFSNLPIAWAHNTYSHFVWSHCFREFKILIQYWIKSTRNVR